MLQGEQVILTRLRAPGLSRLTARLSGPHLWRYGERAWAARLDQAPALAVRCAAAWAGPTAMVVPKTANFCELFAHAPARPDRVLWPPWRPPPRRDGSSGNRTVCAKPLWARCPSRTGSAGSLENCQRLPTNLEARRRAGNIPASDPDTAPRPSTVSRAMPYKRKRQDPAIGGGAKVLQPQYSCRARRGVWKAPAHAHRVFVE